MTYKSKSLVQAIDYNTLVGSGVTSSSGSSNTITVTSFRDIPYGTDNLQTVDILVPSTTDINSTTGTNPPKGVIVWIHGGAWQNGDKADSRATYVTEPLVISNYIVISVNYRLTLTNTQNPVPNGFYPNDVEDVKTVLKFLLVDGSGLANAPTGSSQQLWNILRQYVKTYGLFVTGESAGGHLSIMGVLETAKDNGGVFPRAVMNIVGPMNLVLNTDSSSPSYNPYGTTALSIVQLYSQNNPTKLVAASPYYRLLDTSAVGWKQSIPNFANTDCKFYFWYNDQDTLVPPTSITPFYDTLKQYLPSNVFKVEVASGSPRISAPGGNGDGYPATFVADHNMVGISPADLITTNLPSVFPIVYVPTVTPNAINSVLGVGSGLSGYGQLALTPIGDPAIGRTIISHTDWDILINTVNLIASQQNTIIPTLTAPAINNKVTYDQDLINSVNLIYINRYNTGVQDTPVVTNAVNSATWNSLATFEHRIAFDAPDKARYFFNMGGQIKLEFSATSGTGIDAAFNTLASSIGKLYISAVSNGSQTINGVSYNGVTVVTTTPAAGAGNILSSSSGYYGLTTSYTEIFRRTVGGTGTGNGSYISVLAKTNGSQGGNGDNGTIITITTTFVQVPSGTNTVASGSTVVCTVIPPLLNTSTLNLTDPITGSPFTSSVSAQWTAKWANPVVSNTTTVSNKTTVPATLGALTINPTTVAAGKPVTVTIDATNAVLQKWVMTVTGSAGATSGTTLTFGDTVTTSPQTIRQIFTPVIADTLAIAFSLDSGVKTSGSIVVSTPVYNNTVTIPASILIGENLTIVFSGTPKDTVTAYGLLTPTDPTIVVDITMDNIGNVTYTFANGTTNTTTDGLKIDGGIATFTGGGKVFNFSRTSGVVTRTVTGNGVNAGDPTTVDPTIPQVFTLDSNGSYTYTRLNYSGVAAIISLKFIFGNDSKNNIVKSLSINDANNKPPVSTYNLVAASSTVKPGDKITFVLTTTNVTDGTNIRFTISGTDNTNLIPVYITDFSDILVNTKSIGTDSLTGTKNNFVMQANISTLELVTSTDNTIPQKVITVALDSKYGVITASVTTLASTPIGSKLLFTSPGRSQEITVTNKTYLQTITNAATMPLEWLPDTPEFASIALTDTWNLVASNYPNGINMQLQVYYIDTTTGAVIVPAIITQPFTSGTATITIPITSAIYTDPKNKTNKYTDLTLFCILTINGTGIPGPGRTYPDYFYGKLKRGNPIPTWQIDGPYNGDPYTTGSVKDNNFVSHPAYNPTPLQLVPGNDNASTIELTPGTAGQKYNQIAYVINGQYVKNYVWQGVGNVPDGTTALVSTPDKGYLQKQVTLSGTPTIPGTFTFTATVVNGTASVSQDYSIAIAPDEQITTKNYTESGQKDSAPFDVIISYAIPGDEVTYTGYFDNDTTKTFNSDTVGKVGADGTCTFANVTLGGPHSYNTTFKFKKSGNTRTKTFTILAPVGGVVTPPPPGTFDEKIVMGSDYSTTNQLDNVKFSINVTGAKPGDTISLSGYKGNDKANKITGLPTQTTTTEGTFTYYDLVFPANSYHFDATFAGTGHTRSIEFTTYAPPVTPGVTIYDEKVTLDTLGAPGNSQNPYKPGNQVVNTPFVIWIDNGQPGTVVTVTDITDPANPVIRSDPAHNTIRLQPGSDPNIALRFGYTVNDNPSYPTVGNHTYQFDFEGGHYRTVQFDIAESTLPAQTYSEVIAFNNYKSGTTDNATPVDIVISGGKPNTSFAVTGYLNSDETNTITEVDGILKADGTYTISKQVFSMSSADTTYHLTFTFTGSGNIIPKDILIVAAAVTPPPPSGSAMYLATDLSSNTADFGSTTNFYVYLAPYHQTYELNFSPSGGETGTTSPSGTWNLGSYTFAHEGVNVFTITVGGVTATLNITVGANPSTTTTTTTTTTPANNSVSVFLTDDNPDYPDGTPYGGSMFDITTFRLDCAGTPGAIITTDIIKNGVTQNSNVTVGTLDSTGKFSQDYPPLDAAIWTFNIAFTLGSPRSFPDPIELNVQHYDPNLFIDNGDPSGGAGSAGIVSPPSSNLYLTTNNTSSTNLNLGLPESSIFWNKASRETLPVNPAWRNWGLLRCTQSSALPAWSNWGSDNRLDMAGTVNLKYTGKNVDIVILDLGSIDPNHPEFALNVDGTGGSRVKSYNWLQWSQTLGYGQNTTYDPGSYNTYDSNHAAHCAGIASGNTNGWARSSNIYSLNYLQLPGGTSNGLAQAFDYIAQFHINKNNTNPTIVSCSVVWMFTEKKYTDITSVTYRGTTYTPADFSTTSFTEELLQTVGILDIYGSGSITITQRNNTVDAAVKRCIDAGVTVVSVAGNFSSYIDVPNGIDYDNYFTDTAGYTHYYHRGTSPGTTDGVICVGAIDSTVSEVKAYYSGNGPRVDIFAPGTDIMSSMNTVKGVYSQSLGSSLPNVPDPRNNNYYLGKDSGTSMACPQVVGSIACLLEKFGLGYTPQQIKSYITSAATVGSLQSPTVGYGSNSDLNGAPNRILYVPDILIK